MVPSLYPLIIVLLAGLAIWIHLKFISPQLEIILQKLGAMPKASTGKISETLLRVLRLNWYTVLMMALLWLLLFGPQVGADIIEDYRSNISAIHFFEKCGSLFFLAFSLLLLSMSIWILPFFMYGKSRQDQIKKNTSGFYLGTKMLALLAMVPYGIVGSAFLLALRNHLQPDKPSFLLYLLLNLFFIALFFCVQAIISKAGNNAFIKRLVFKKEFTKNGYVNLLISIFLWHLVLILISASILWFIPPATSGFWILPAYMLLSSSIVFRLMYYTNETGLNASQVEALILKMLETENKKHSRFIYKFLGFSLLGGMLFYFVVPSLTGTNSLYVLVIVFGFIIIYLDYMRNLFRNGTGRVKIFALVAILVFLVMPFVTPKKQFIVPLIPYADPGPKISLDSALALRLQKINGIDSNGNIYIVCGMGGGSRAGFITASALEVLDSIDPSFFQKTLCYSTVSGSSPGVYHYLKEREAGLLNTGFLRHVYQQNYNSSGIFGLLFADATGALLGPLLYMPLSLFSDSTPGNGYMDRNVRIRCEYEVAMQQALAITSDSSNNWATKTFALHTRNRNYKPDSFEQYYNRQAGEIPVHLINTFEVNSGRRAVLSPFAVSDTSVFTNSILPLQDVSFDKDIFKKDMMYRDAVNLSELFPLLSGASQIGDLNKAQFVDGGYFENYGLATALDILDYIKRTYDTITLRRIKIILIKNSQQETDTIKHRSIQLIAPLTGATSSPFTGHANHFLQLTKNRLTNEGFYQVLFDAKKYSVPLTRALTANHIDSMLLFKQSLLKDRGDSLRNFLKGEPEIKQVQVKL